MVLTGLGGNPINILAKQINTKLHKVRPKCPLYETSAGYGVAQVNFFSFFKYFVFSFWRSFFMRRLSHFSWADLWIWNARVWQYESQIIIFQESPWKVLKNVLKYCLLFGTLEILFCKRFFVTVSNSNIFPPGKPFFYILFFKFEFRLETLYLLILSYC